MRCPQHHAGGRHFLPIKQSSYPKVGDHNPLFLFIHEHDVGRFNVTVHHVFAVRILQSGRQLSNDVNRSIKVQRAIFLQIIFERPPFYKLHHHVRQIIFGIKID